MGKNVILVGRTFSPSEVKELFNQEALLFGNFCGVPLVRAAELFGRDAVNFVHRLCRGSAARGDAFMIGGFGIGGYTAGFLTECGVRAAASFCNACAVKRLEVPRIED